MLIPQSFDNVIGSLGFDYFLIFLIGCWLVVTWWHNRCFEAPRSCRWLRILRHASGGAESFCHWKSLWFGSDINQWHHKHLASRDVFRFILIILIFSALLWIFLFGFRLAHFGCTLFQRSSLIINPELCLFRRPWTGDEGHHWTTDEGPRADRCSHQPWQQWRTIAGCTWKIYWCHGWLRMMQWGQGG